MTTSHRSGRHFLQIPGPTNVPDRILRAIDRPTIDHRGPDFVRLAAEILDGIRPIFKTAGPVVIYPASGTGAWEAALVNTLSPGDPVLMVETGHFASLWCAMARRLGLEVELLPGDWRHGVDPERVEATLAEDRGAARSRPSASSTTRPRPGSPRGSQKCGARSTAPAIRRCSWSTPSPRSPRSTTATTSGGSTSRSRARRRA